MFNWSAKCSYFSFEMHVSHIWRDRKEYYFSVRSGSSWVGNRHCIERLVISSIFLLFFNMIIFSSLISMFLVGKSSRDICSRLVRSSCSPLVYFESVRSGQLVLLYNMLKLSCEVSSLLELSYFE